MELLPNEILEKLQAQDMYHPSGPGRELSSEELIVVVQYMMMDSDWKWYACSASKDEISGDVQFFGLVNGLEIELGYFWLSELKKARGSFKLPVQRNPFWRERTLKEVMQEVGYAWVS